MRAYLAIALALAAAPAAAQQNTPLMPFVYPVTVGTTPIQVLPQNNARKRVLFHNPSSTATVAVCPLFRRDTSAAVVCAVGGPGSITLLPGASFQFDGVQPTGNPVIPTGWSAVASAASSPLSVFEYE